MYHHLSSNQEHLKKEKAVLERKYKRKTDRLRAMESELKQTREQVSDFKQRFRALSQYIQLKGGLPYLNSLPDIGRGEEEVPDNISVGGTSIATNTNRISIRGGGQRGSGRSQAGAGENAGGSRPVIRGGGGAA